MVFVGGSLVNKGGQNPIEAAAYAKPVIYGKHMFNFESEVKALTSNGGVEIEDETELKDIIEKFMYDEPFRIQLGAKAARVVEQQKGAVAKNIKIIKNV